uniref:SXP/RAL-2 family protein Ani s 5-like cation-binding domain-containing protein n=1 Tax=Panagrolaimus sp. ES5 TaxID=591445 RepID=A0AC34G0U5_9BILA
MASFKIILACCLIAFVSAAPIGGEFGGIFGDLQNSLNDEQKQQLKAIFTNDALTKQEIQDQIKAYFEKIGGDALNKFNELHGTFETKKDEMIKKVEDATSNMSDGAKQLVAQIKEIKENMQITNAQDQEQMKALFDKAPEDVKNELKSLKDLFGGNHEEHASA